MSDWATWNAELPRLFKSLLGIPCDWADQPRPMHTGARGQLAVIATPADGTEDRRQSTDAGLLIEEIVGHRRMVLQVSVWSPSQPLAQSARAFLERLRTRLAFDSSQEALRRLRLSYQTTENPVALDRVEDGRQVSFWAMDVVLGYVWSEQDETNVGSFIETGRITADTADDVDGTPLHAGLQSDINPPE